MTILTFLFHQTQSIFVNSKGQTDSKLTELVVLAELKLHDSNQEIIRLQRELDDSRRALALNAVNLTKIIFTNILT